jgi:hypothetical protein
VLHRPVELARIIGKFDSLGNEPAWVSMLSTPGIPWLAFGEIVFFVLAVSLRLASCQEEVQNRQENPRHSAILILLNEDKFWIAQHPSGMPQSSLHLAWAGESLSM